MIFPRSFFSLTVAFLTTAAVSVLIGGRGVSAQPGGDVLLREARRLRSEHHPEQAEAVLQPLLAQKPGNAQALALLGEIRLDEGKRKEAAALLTRALAADPNSMEANDALGGLLLNDHLYPEAMDRFETALTAAPADAEARRGELTAASELAVKARGSGHPEIALEVLQHARTKLPDDPKLLVDLGIQATELRLLAEAADALNAARKLAPNGPDVLYALARLAIEQQDMTAAEADFRAYLAIKPGDASAHYGLGRIFAIQQRADDARTEFERSIALQPVQTESYYQLGQLDLDAQQDAQADALFRKALERDSHHGGALTGMGILAFRAKEYAKAEQYLADAEKTAPDYAPAHYYRGLALARLGRKEEADGELRRATDLGHAAADPVSQQPATTEPAIPQSL